MTQSEYNFFLSPKDQQCTICAYKQRNQRQRSVRLCGEEKRLGMKCVDFFMDYIQFLGISNNGHQFREWILRVT